MKPDRKQKLHHLSQKNAKVIGSGSPLNSARIMD